MIIPKKLAIYYGYPSLVNGSSTIQEAVDTFKVYDLIVFGAGLENILHPDYLKTIQIINHQEMTQTEIYGYIDSTLSITNIKVKIDLWKLTGVEGIFCDQFGFDFGLNRNKQNQIVNYVHQKNLKAFVNAWDPDDVFDPSIKPNCNPNGELCKLGIDDWYLAQSFAIKLGQYDDIDTDTDGNTDWEEKAQKMINYKNTYLTKMATITTYDTSSYDQNKADYGYYASVIHNFDAWGFGEENFSAVSTLLPYRSRKIVIGTVFTTTINKNGNILERDTNGGISINTINHTISNIMVD